MNTSKTWLESEIITLIADEAKAYRHDCQLRQRTWSYQEMAENILAVLDAKGLIEYTP